MATDRNSLCKIWEHGPVLSDLVLPESEMQMFRDYLDRVKGRRPEDRSLVLLLTGPSGTGKTLSARALAHHLDRSLLLVDPIGGLFRKNELEERLAQMVREARLLNGILFFDECEGWFESRVGGDRNVLRMLELLDRQSQDVILATNMPEMLDPALDRRIALRLDYRVPNRGLRCLLWEKHLSQLPFVDTIDTTWLAERYELTGGHILNASEAASQLARIRGVNEPITHQDVETAAEQQVRHRLSRLAVETPTHLKLEDLIIPNDINDVLLEIISAVRNRRTILEQWGFGRRLSTGKGLCILFKGEPGTGKTLAAEVLSSELRLPLYRASVARIVSKYVGETERNLERTFKEATAAGGILLFDEADSLFSKRIEVSSAQDRYSNMEINLLLQEVERFDGVVILTTNMTAAIDSAFERRLNFKVDFPFPKPDERTKIWKVLIPQEAPVADNIDYTLLGKLYELSGGSIKNVILRAAYKAAQCSVQIDMKGLESAAQQEYRELGKLLPDGSR
jgi:SpoVK/Ycf46/Vps4 family AAA+-type ATPase